MSEQTEYYNIKRMVWLQMNKGFSLYKLISSLQLIKANIYFFLSMGTKFAVIQ